MKGIVLGSGTGIPSPSRNSAGYFLEAGGLNLLIDCGPGTMRRLVRARKGVTNLDAIFITHTHPDHVSDLTPLVHALRVAGAGRRKKMSIYGPPGFLDYFEKIVLSQVKLPGHFTVEAFEAPDSWSMGDLVVRSWPTVHSDVIKSVAFRFEENGRSVVFSGDCDYDQALIDGSRHADVLILDCCTLDSDKMEGHLSAGLAGLVAAKAEVKHLIPTHFYPIPASDADRVEECRIQFSGKITLAEDLMTFEV